MSNATHLSLTECGLPHEREGSGESTRTSGLGAMWVCDTTHSRQGQRETQHRSKRQEVGNPGIFWGREPRKWAKMVR